MKLNESNLADPLLLGCALSGPPWGSGGPFGGQDLISTTTFPDDALLLPPGSNANGGGGGGGGGGALLCKGLPSGSSPPGQTGVELDALIMVQSSDSFAELKPLPPFDYGPAASQLALQNDPHLPQMGSASNSPPNHLTSTTGGGGGGGGGAHHHNPLRHGGGGSTGSGSSIGSSPPGNSFGSPLAGSPNSLFEVVSSSTSVPAHLKTELAEYLLNSDIDDIAALIGNAIADSTVPNLGIELTDQNGVTSSTIDPWTELDAWIESACQQQTHEVSSGTPTTTNHTSTNGSGPNNSNNHNNNNHNNHGPNHRTNQQQHQTQILLEQDGTIHTSAENNHFLDSTTATTLQTLLAATTHFSGGGPGGNNNGPPPMYGQQDLKSFQATSILQSRLQAPPANGGTQSGGGSLRVATGGGPGTSPNQLPESTTAHFGIKVEPYTLDPGSPPFIDPITGEVAQRPHTTHVSPPAVVTSSMIPGGGSGRYNRKSGYSKMGNSNKSAGSNNNNNNGLSSNNLAGGGGYHHGPVGDTNGFLSAFGSPTTSTPFDPSNPSGHADQTSSKLGLKTKRKSSKLPSSTGLGSPLDPCGKEKPIHRCNVCNRGFLNKSNIKVHLRTHTGEKPFKCDVCGKAFRQKAHLLKHIQIHKRIPRD